MSEVEHPALVVEKSPSRSVGELLWLPRGGTIHGGRRGLGRDDGMCAPQHANFEIAMDGAVTLRDLRSTNGTYVNGHLIDRVTLAPGDKIGIGSSLYVFVVLPASAWNCPACAAPLDVDHDMPHGNRVLFACTGCRSVIRTAHPVNRVEMTGAAVLRILEATRDRSAVETVALFRLQRLPTWILGLPELGGLEQKFRRVRLTQARTVSLTPTAEEEILAAGSILEARLEAWMVIAFIPTGPSAIHASIEIPLDQLEPAE